MTGNASDIDDLVLRATNSLAVTELGGDFEDPENVVVRVAEGRRKPLDFGSIAFTNREQRISTGHHYFSTIKVDPNSLLVHRRKVLFFLFDHIYCNNQRPATLKKLYFSTRMVFNFLDSHGLHNGFLNEDCARVAYENYTKSLQIQITCDIISWQSAYERQGFFKWLIMNVFVPNGSSIIRGILSIRSKKVHFRVPEEVEVKRFVQTTHAVATTLTKFILEKENFPFLLEATDIRQYIFPFNSNFKRNPENVHFYDLVDRDSGNFKTVEELSRRHPNFSKSKIKYVLKMAASKLIVYNQERSFARMRIASIALSAHILLIQHITGMSPSELREVKYAEVVDPRSGNIKSELCSVKRRAKGKKTRYAIGGKIGRRILLSYLRIRSWVLDKGNCPYLFIRLERNGSYSSKVGQLHSAFSNPAHSRIKKLFNDETIPLIGSSLSRKYKSLILHELKTPAGLVSSILNHDQITNGTAYAETTEDRSQREFQRYWKSVRAYAVKVIAGSRKIDNADVQSNAVGRCKQLNNPEILSENPPVKPDCRTQFGCLYCKQYIFHADAEDVHKVISMQYVINEIRASARHAQHADSLLQDLSIRIDHIVDRASELSATHSDLISQVRRRVFELGHLTPFWENRLARLELIGGVLT